MRSSARAGVSPTVVRRNGLHTTALFRRPVRARPAGLDATTGGEPRAYWRLEASNSDCAPSGTVNDGWRGCALPAMQFRQTGPGGQQILIDDPSGNPIELFQPAGT